jgi:hypothetical protein
LVAALRRRLDGAAADTLFGAGVAVGAIAIVGAVLQAGLTHAEARLGDAGLLSYFAAERMLFYVAPALAIVLVALSAALAFRGVLPGWLTVASGLLASSLWSPGSRRPSANPMPPRPSGSSASS